jgi:hypothetical protein
MITTAVYEVNLYLNGVLVGDCRSLAQNLSYSRKRTKVGADSIDFTINDVLFDKWCQDRNYSINDLLKPIALECRLIRNGIEIIGGFLATMPAYSPLQTSANLDLHFDGFLNLLSGFYIRDTATNLPLGTVTGAMGSLVSSLIDLADNTATSAGKAYGFTEGVVDALPNITNTFDNYKTVKDWICERCDNTSGAGPFDVYFHADKTYDIYKDSNFGDIINDWVAFYPTLPNSTSVTSISAAEIGGFASAVIGLGAGEISANADENTVLYDFITDNDSIIEYGYMESIYQDSSISTPSVLAHNMEAQLLENANPIWKPEITLHGKQVAPKPSGSNKIWVGDTITINNSLDLTGMTNGQFRVNELNVSVTAAGDETINPILERV